jgi:autotransporter passenger strand-loop-strand repeat protein
VSAVEGEQIISAGGNAQRTVISSGSLEQVDGYEDNDFVFSGGTQQLNVGGTAIGAWYPRPSLGRRQDGVGEKLAAPPHHFGNWAKRIFPGSPAQGSS